MDYDNLTDAEIRAKLEEYDLPNYPITDFTRKVILSRLKRSIESGKRSSRSGRMSLGNYSSGEEGDNEVIKKKTKRLTIAVPQSTRKPNDNGHAIKTTPPKKSVQLRRSSVNKDEDENGDDLCSDPEEIAVQAVKKSPRVFTPVRTTTHFTPIRSSAAANNTNSNTSAAERLDRIRSRLSLPSTPKPYHSESTPFLSNYTRRLSELKGTNKSYSNDIKENDHVGRSFCGFSPWIRKENKIQQNTYKYWRMFCNNWTSFMVLILAVVFFVLLAVFYMNLPSDISPDSTAVIPYCDDEHTTNSDKLENCILREDKENAFNLLKILKKELQQSATDSYCLNNRNSYMTITDIVEFIKNKYYIQDEELVQSDLSNLQILLFLNPLWGVKVLNIDENNTVKHIKNLNDLDRNQTVAFTLKNPQYPVKCYLYKIFEPLIRIVPTVIFGVVVLYILNSCFKYWNYYRLRHKEEEIQLLEQIIEILQTNTNDDNCVVINHVRDMIIPIKERKKKEKMWLRAVKYLNEHESRIRTEIQVIHGEPNEVWRWLGPIPSRENSPKIWQGQAFETQLGSVNSLPCSPTPCIKIRGMIVDQDADTIRKAILTKCGPQCRILHCSIDWNAKCIYLKCVDTNDAAIAYSNLHGWWYSGTLVTVKYLRLERYMQRFPDSPVKGPLLKP